MRRERAADGSAQRSEVTSLTVTFDRVVTFVGDPSAAFSLVKRGGGMVGLSVSTAVVNGVTVATLTFTGPLTQFGSLADGNYILMVSSGQITDGLADGDYFATVFRLFGDANGDGVVNIADLSLFRTVYGAATTDRTFDFDGDGVISAADLAAFTARFGSSVP